jgi:hypothetical protein
VQKLPSVMLPLHSIRVAARQVDLADQPLRQRDAAASRNLLAPAIEAAAHGEVAVCCNDECRPGGRARGGVERR